MDLNLTDEQQLIKSTAREFTDKELIPVADANSKNHHFDTRSRRQDRRPGLPRRDRPAAVRRRGPGLRHVRPDLRGDRPRLLGDAHRHLRPDLARLLDDPQVGHRGAEAALPARCCAPASGSAAFGLTEPGHRVRRRQPEDARVVAAGRRLDDQRREDVDLARQPRQALRSSSPRRIRRSRTRGSPASWSRPTSRGSSRRRSRARWACGRPTPRRSRSTTSHPGGQHARRRRRRLQGRDERPGLRALQRRRRLRRHLPGLARRVRAGTRRSAPSSTVRSPASSWSRR